MLCARFSILRHRSLLLRNCLLLMKPAFVRWWIMPGRVIWHPDKSMNCWMLRGLARAREGVADTEEEIVALAKSIGFPLVMKVVGPVHKSDVGGVTLNVCDEATVRSEFRR